MVEIYSQHAKIVGPKEALDQIVRIFEESNISTSFVSGNETCRFYYFINRSGVRGILVTPVVVDGMRVEGLMDLMECFPQVGFEFLNAGMTRSERLVMKENVIIYEAYPVEWGEPVFLEGERYRPLESCDAPWVIIDAQGRYTYDWSI